MKRAPLLLAILAAVLVVVLWFLLLWSPTSDRIADTEARTDQVRANQDVARARIASLQDVRERAPQIQADVAAGESILPRSTALPSALRQLQQAADDSGAVLVSVTPGRPVPVTDAAQAVVGDGSLHAMDLALELRGSYFQIVDVLRRLEDPAITPRGMSWSAMTLSIEEYPELTVAMTGRIFAVLEGAADPAALPDATATDPVPATPDPATEAPAEEVIQ